MLHKRMFGFHVSEGGGVEVLGGEKNVTIRFFIKNYKKMCFASKYTQNVKFEIFKGVVINVRYGIMRYVIFRVF